jgi:hypothetical protein
MTPVAKRDGALRRILEDARRDLKCCRNNLTVLSTQVDPYRLDTPAGHRDGAWLAEQLDRAIGPDRRIHWRGLHYAIVAAGAVENRTAWSTGMITPSGPGSSITLGRPPGGWDTSISSGSPTTVTRNR